jgi:hypothetical protein
VAPDEKTDEDSDTQTSPECCVGILMNKFIGGLCSSLGLVKSLSVSVFGFLQRLDDALLGRSRLIARFAGGCFKGFHSFLDRLLESRSGFIFMIRDLRPAGT